MVALREAVKGAGGEVVAVSHRVGTHIFAPAPEPEGEPKGELAGDQPEVRKRGKAE